MEKINLTEYMQLFMKIIYLTIFKYPTVTLIAIFAALLTFGSTYFAVKISDTITTLTKTFKTEKFDESLMKFLYVSLIALFLRYIPKVLYTYTLQETCRKKFVHYLREYLELSYVDFQKKTPGELRFLIFLKAYASVMCTNLVVFETSLLFGTIIFSFIKIKKDVNVISAIIFATIPAVYIAGIIQYIKIKLQYQQVLLDKQQISSTKLYDKLLNYEIIKTFNLEQAEADSMQETLHQQGKAQVKMGIFDAKSNFILTSLLTFPYLLIVWLYFVGYSSMHSSDLFKATILYTALASQLKRLGHELTNLMMYLNQIRFGEVHDQSFINGRVLDSITDFKDKIEFKDVTIYYKDQAIINNINAVINKGQKIAVVGKNGTGKSTFIKTLLGFTNYTGDILIDGKNVRDLSNKSILKLISYIPQDDYTSDDTVLENLMRGNPNATREEIEEKARIFDAHDYFMSLEKGYDTHVGPRGNKLSGGQKQKLSIVRAAVKDGDIFILDEATASMDKQYEKKIIPQMINNLSMKTVIMIVHGKDYLRFFDNIFFFNEGRLEAFGKYDDLKRTSENFSVFVK